jgi:heavy metal sensor kinase
MRESLRARLLIWHTAAVAAVIFAFGTSIAYDTWRTRLQSVDDRLVARASEVARAVATAGDGRVDVTLGPGLRYEDAPDVYHAIWTADGTLVDRSDASIPVPRPAGAGAWTREGRREVALVAPSGVLVVAGTDLAGVRGEIWALVGVLGATGAAILALSTALGWWLVGRALEPLDRINKTAQRMTDGDLGARISVDSIDSEIGQFARALNSAFDRLQGAIDRQRRFTADASHELRTPLTALSTEVQWALSRPRSTEELRSSLEVASRAAVRMQSVIERLLALARDEATPLRSTVVSLAETARQAVDTVQALAEAAGVTLALDLEPLVLEGDPDQLREAVTNVLTNAIRYNVENGRVDVSLRRRDGATELSIADTGIGIAPADLPHVFDPFFRGDPARSRDTGGAGLGLALTRTIVERHGGTITCESTPGRGTTVTMRWGN